MRHGAGGSETENAQNGFSLDLSPCERVSCICRRSAEEADPRSREAQEGFVEDEGGGEGSVGEVDLLGL